MGIQRVHSEADTDVSLDVLWDTLQDYETWSTWGPWQRAELRAARPRFARGRRIDTLP